MSRSAWCPGDEESCDRFLGADSSAAQRHARPLDSPQSHMSIKIIKSKRAGKLVHIFQHPSGFPSPPKKKSFDIIR